MRIQPIIKCAALMVLVVIIVMSVVGPADKSEDAVGDAATIVQTETGATQRAVLKMVDYGYVLEPSTLNKNVPVLLEGDMDSLFGCMRDIRIPAFGVKKLLSEGDNTVMFTPTKTGTFKIACSMNMGQGSFEVVGK